MSVEIEPFSLEYKVSVNIRLTATDLRLIQRASAAHYDYNCRTFFSDKQPAPGNYWRNMFFVRDAEGGIVNDLDPLDESVPGDTVSDQIKVSFDDIDRVSKILEMSHYVENEDEVGHGLSLKIQFKKVIIAIQDEHKRLQLEQYAKEKEALAENPNPERLETIDRYVLALERF
jgi:hypothetical protein